MESSVKRMLPITQICRKTVQTSLKSVQQDDHKKTVTAEIVQDLPVANDLISAIIDCEEKPKVCIDAFRVFQFLFIVRIMEILRKLLKRINACFLQERHLRQIELQSCSINYNKMEISFKM